MRWRLNIFFLILGGFLGTIVLLISFSFIPRYQLTSAPTQAPVSKPTPPPIITESTPTQTTSFKIDLTTYLASRPGEWALDLARETRHRPPKEDSSAETVTSLNSNRLFPAASVMKLTTALTVANQILKGNLSPATVIGNQTVAAWLQALINRSDNRAWDILRSSIGYGQELKLIKLLGLTQTDLSQNAISAGDANRLLQTIWLNRDQTAVANLLKRMVRTETETRIPQGVEEFFRNTGRSLPPVYHKTGTWPPTGTYNDVAIIPLKDNVWYLSILSQGKQTRAQAEETIRTVTKLILKRTT